MVIFHLNLKSVCLKFYSDCHPYFLFIEFFLYFLDWLFNIGDMGHPCLVPFHIFAVADLSYFCCLVSVKIIRGTFFK